MSVVEEELCKDNGSTLSCVSETVSGSVVLCILDVMFFIVFVVLASINVDDEV